MLNPARIASQTNPAAAAILITGRPRPTCMKTSTTMSALRTATPTFTAALSPPSGMYELPHVIASSMRSAIHA